MARIPSNPAYTVVRGADDIITVTHNRRGTVLRISVWQVDKTMGPRWAMLDRDRMIWDTLPEYVRIGVDDMIGRG
mgnify:CR=1 FL=1